MKTKKFPFKIFDLLIFLSLIGISALLIFQLFSGSKDKILVQVDNESYEFPLTQEEKIYEVRGPLGITKIQVENFKARIIDSPCPNKTCVSVGFSNPIVCLPNHVIVQVIRQEESEENFDVISE